MLESLIDLPAHERTSSGNYPRSAQDRLHIDACESRMLLVRTVGAIRPVVMPQLLTDTKVVFGADEWSVTARCTGNATQGKL